MNSSVNLIEVLSDGKYRLNEHELQSIVSKAEECNDFAVISIIGEKYSGKTKLMNSLVKYLECEDKKSWPKDCVIQYNTGFKNDRKDKKEKPVLQMWSKPFILEANGHKTAVLLIDTSHIFQSMKGLLSTKVAQDLIGLIFSISSTVIFSDSVLTTNICEITEFIPKVYEFIGKSFQEMIYLIFNWNSEHNKYTLGLKGGQQYVQDQTQYTQLNKYFKNIECCLLPPAGPALHTSDLKFNYLNEEFVFQFSELIKNRVLNIDRMQVKRHPVSQKVLRPQELVVLLQSYVHKLNGDSVSNDFGLSDETIDSNEELYYSSDSTQNSDQKPTNSEFMENMKSNDKNNSNEEPNEEEVNDSSDSTPNILKINSLSPQVLQNLLKEKQKEFNEYMNALKKASEEIVEINKALEQNDHGHSNGYSNDIHSEVIDNQCDEHSDDIKSSEDFIHLSDNDLDFDEKEINEKIGDKTEKQENNFSKDQEYDNKSKFTQTLPKTSFVIHFNRYNFFAGFYDTEFRPVLDKFGNRCRPNCIAFSNDFLFGSQAIQHNNIFGKLSVDPYFDFLSLFKMRSGLTEDELNSCPLTLKQNNNKELKVKIQNKISYEFKIESLIALQVLDIKSDAEKHFGSTITGAVFTVPNHFTIEQLNALKDVATIAGLESVHILSEITAAAIGYSFELRIQTETNVLFVAINDFECSAAVCQINGIQIEYLCFLHENLLSHKKTGLMKSYEIWNISNNDQVQFERIKNSFIKLLEKIMQNIKTIKQIQNIVLIGDSKIAVQLKNCLFKYFGGQPIIVHDCIYGYDSNIVVKGSTIFCKTIIS